MALPLPNRAFGVDYSTYPAPNGPFARITAPDQVLIQDARKRLTTNARFIFWSAALKTGLLPCIDLRDYLLDTGSQTELRQLVRDVLQASPMVSRADALILPSSDPAILRLRVVIWGVRGQKLTLDITATPAAVTVTAAPESQ